MWYSSSYLFLKSVCVATILFAAAATVSAQSIDLQFDEVRRLVDYYHLNLNTLADNEVSTADKDIIIRESYLKLFRDAKVQIEDDLDPDRITVTYKDVQAYLQDVNFFFQTAEFEYTLTSIDALSKNDGSPYFLVRTIRTLDALGVRGDSVLNDQVRFIEIDQTGEGLKIASVYTTKLNSQQERRLWWAELDEEWRMRLAGSTQLFPGFELADVRNYAPGVLLTAEDTFLLKGYKHAIISDDSLHLVLFRDTISIIGLDSLPLSHREIDIFLEGLTSQRSLDFSGDRTLKEIRPLGKMKSLEYLDISNTAVEDLNPLRALSAMQVLLISESSVHSADALRYLRNLEELQAASVNITGLNISLPELRKLNLSYCPLDSVFELDNFPVLESLDLSLTPVSFIRANQQKNILHLEQLNVSGSSVKSLPLFPKGNALTTVIASGSSLENLDGLQHAISLQRVDIDDTEVSNLTPLNGLPALSRINCDNSLVSDGMARLFEKENPGCLVVRDSEVLRAWWSSLDKEWQRALKLQLGNNFELDQGIVSRETLHRLTRLTQLDLRSFTALSQLNAIVQLRDLEILQIAGLAVEDISPLSELKTLRELYLNECPVKDLKPLSETNTLERLHIEGTLVTELSALEKCKELRYVLADHSKLTDSAVTAFRAVRPEVLVVFRTAHLQQWWSELSEDWQLFLSGVRGLSAFSSAPDNEELEALTRIRTLIIPPGSVSHLRPLEEFRDIEKLEFAGNPIRSIWPIAECKKLRILNFSDTPVEDIEVLREIRTLEKLTFNNTAVDRLDALTHSLRLTELSFAGTPVRSLNPLQLHQKLETIDCANTRIRSLKPLDDIPALRTLIIFNTPLPASRVDRFRAEHPDTSVTFY